MTGIERRWFSVLVRLYPSDVARAGREDLWLAFEAGAGIIRRKYGALAPAATIALSLLDVLRVRAHRPRTIGTSASPSREHSMSHVIRDLRAAIRSHRHAPGHALLVWLTLSISLGTVLTVCAIANATLFSNPGLHDVDRVVVFWETWPPKFPWFPVSPGAFTTWSSALTSVVGLGGYSTSDITLTAPGALAERLRLTDVTPGTLALVGAAPIAGQVPSATDHDGVAISAGLASRRFGSAAAAVGQSVIIDGIGHPIAAVLSPAFRFPADDVAIWRPLLLTPKDRQSFGAHYLQVVGRLRPGATVAQLSAELATISRSLEAAQPATNKGWGATVTTWRDEAGETARPLVTILAWSAAAVLAIALANVIALVIIRTAARSRELSVRSALGASRRRIAGMLGAEMFVLSAAAGGAALALTWAALRILTASPPSAMKQVAHAAIGQTELGIAAISILGSTIVLSCVPALIVSLTPRISLHTRADSLLPRQRRVQQLTVIIEVAASVVIVLGAALMWRSVTVLAGVDPGFDPRGVLTAPLTLPEDAYTSNDKRVVTINQLLDGVSHIPGVERAAVTQALPFVGNFLMAVKAEGVQESVTSTITPNIYLVSPDYFRTLEIPLRQGRVFSPHDDGLAAPVAIVNETTARQLFGGHALGRHISVLSDPIRPAEIVGVVADVKHGSLTRPAPLQVYEPYAQRPFRSVTLSIRSSPETTGILTAVNRVMNGVDPGLALGREVELESALGRSFAQQRFTMQLLFGFGIAALMMCAGSVFGLVTQFAHHQRRETAIRLALGEQPAVAGRRLLVRIGTLAVVGLVIGFGSASLAPDLLGSLLYGVTRLDPASFLAAGSIVLAVALAAALVPSIRQSRVDPVEVLKTE
jgi:putative ABC transport system permease protein